MKSLLELRSKMLADLDVGIEDAVGRFSGGQAGDYAAYKYGCGIAQGLVRAKQVVVNAFVKITDEESDDV